MESTLTQRFSGTIQWLYKLLPDGFAAGAVVRRGNHAGHNWGFLCRYVSITSLSILNYPLSLGGIVSGDNAP
ncbi:hypothetical protein [Stenotrophomonas humi]|uniref:hypothetical protein n=1 Tax=Stenotrophomonas humi TaxID=405444 RepID=UPI000A40CAB1|nr:hypothetical protein [Stenotrophomonas humi]